MKTIAIYAGRFHPPHKGHKATYDFLVRRYGNKNVFVASTNTQAPLTSPFSFEEKKFLMTALGIPAANIVQVKNPYKADEITSKFDSKDTAVVFAVSEKDAGRFSFSKKDGTAAYLQPMSDKIELQPYSAHAYVELAPTIQFNVAGVEVKSASAIRSLYINSNSEQRDKIIVDLYGSFMPKVKQLLDRKLGLSEAAATLIAAYSGILTESVSSSTYAQLSKIFAAEEAVHKEFFI